MATIQKWGPQPAATAETTQNSKYLICPQKLPSRLTLEEASEHALRPSRMMDLEEVARMQMSKQSTMKNCALLMAIALTKFKAQCLGWTRKVGLLALFLLRRSRRAAYFRTMTKRFWAPAMKGHRQILTLRWVMLIMVLVRLVQNWNQLTRPILSELSKRHSRQTRHSVLFQSRVGPHLLLICRQKMAPKMAARICSRAPSGSIYLKVQ
mmetsp:Transcript_5605/g.11539  ORF Transcript_5605/g.11539 Transcript_5605/m.11539 type:complete len:209 (+) Transcript_5605:2145-2771(+)